MSVSVSFHHRQNCHVILHPWLRSLWTYQELSLLDRCAVTMGWDAQFMRHNATNSDVYGNLGVAVLPGSSQARHGCVKTWYSYTPLSMNMYRHDVFCRCGIGRATA